MNRINKIIISLSLFLIFIFGTNQVLAYDFQETTGLEDTGREAGYKTTKQASETYLPEYIGVIISAILGMVGVVFLVLMIYGGYLWMTARGNEEQVTKAKSIITRSIIGLIIILAAFVITAFILTSDIFYGATQSQKANLDADISNSTNFKTPGLGDGMKDGTEKWQFNK